MHMLSRVARPTPNAFSLATRSIQSNQHPHHVLVNAIANGGVQHATQPHIGVQGSSVHGRTAARSVASFVRNALSVRRANVHTHVPMQPQQNTNGTDVFAQAQQDVAAALNNPPPSIRSVIVRLLQNLSSKKEVDHYLKYYGGYSQDGANFAVIKIGGGLIQDELDTLVSSLSFLVDVGLLPVVIHGAGPQLNAKLEKKGIVSDYHGGIRVTTPEILQIAKQTFQEENYKLLEALENRGVRARGFQGGVFTAEMLDFQKFQYVGEVTDVNVKLIREQLSKGVVPVITCMAEAVTGQLLNVNADVAAHQLAKTLKPVKIIYLSQAGGLKDKDGNLLSQIDLGSQYEHLMNQEWFTKGNRLKLKEIKSLLDHLPLSSSVSITSAEQLPKELFTHKGSGTLVKRSEAIHSHSNLNGIDQVKLRSLLEGSFGGTLSEEYFKELESELAGLYLSEQYTSTAIVTKLGGVSGVDYLDKFAVDPAAQGTGTAQRLWDILVQKHKKLVWRSRKDNPINSWYFEHSTGSYTPPDSQWTVFFYGLENMQQAAEVMEVVLSKRATLDRSKPSKASLTPGARGFQSWTNAGKRYMSTSARPSKKRIGIVGARGYTGGELMQLLANHTGYELTSANSRALVGQAVGSVVPEVGSSSASWKNLAFGNLSPSELASSKDVDTWILALPNGIAAPYVKEILAARASGKSNVKVIDLSADYRFDREWTYGLPETHGLRDEIKKSSLIANPGCYATAMQKALLPIAKLLSPSAPPSCFGVSGYSGAGTNPSRKNDPVALKDNLMPYSLQGHLHEREVLQQVQRAGSSIQGLNFVPHVAPWFRGITMTVTATLSKPVSEADLRALYRDYFKNERLIKIQDDIPEVQAAAGKHGVTLSIHSAASHPGRVVLCATIDNLLKGAATQALQNLNLISGFEETSGIPL